MAIVAKTSPIGIDLEIDRLQTKLYNYLTVSAWWTDYECYHRAYVNTKKDGSIPEIYIGNKEYKECLMDDKFKATSFFLVDTDYTIENGKAKTNLSLIFQADIAKLYPTIAHRADMEMQKDIYKAIEDSKYLKFLNKITTGYKNVYSEIDVPNDYVSRIKMDDMSNYHVVKFNFTVYFDLHKC
jgi:hypothetical protein